MSYLRAVLPHGPMVTEHVILLHGREGRIRSLAQNAFGMAWDLTPLNIDVLSNDEADNRAGQLASLFHTLPVGATVDIRLDSTPTTTVPQFEASRAHDDNPHIGTQLGHIKSGLVHYQHNRRYSLRQNVVTLGVRLPCISPLPPSMTHYLKTMLVWRAKRVQDRFVMDVSEHLKRDIDIFESRLRSFEASLSTMGFAPQRLTGELLRERISRQLNPCAPSWEYEEAVPLREQVGSEHVETHATGCRIGELDAAVLVPYRGIMKTAPGVLSAARPVFNDYEVMTRAPESLDLIGIVGDLPFSVSVSFHVTDPDQTLVELDAKHRYVSRHTTGLQGEPRQDIQAQETEMGEMLEALSSHTERLLPTGVKVIQWYPRSAEHVAHAVTERLNTSASIVAPKERHIAGELYLQATTLGLDPELPNAERLGTMLPIPCSHTANLVPLWGGYRTRNHGAHQNGMLLLNRLGDPVLFNPFSTTTAPHVVVTGTSRQGKSLFVNTLLHYLEPLGARAYILDIFGSYQGLAEMHGGRHYRLSLIDPVCLGLLDGPLTTEHRSAALNTIAEIDRTGLSAEDLSLLALALEEWARTREAHHEPKTLTGFVEALPRLTHLSPLAPAMFNRLALRLRRYTGSGEFASLIDGPNEMDINVPILSVDIAEFKDLRELRSVAVSLFFSRVLNLVSDPALLNVPKFVIADEVAFLLANPETATFFLTLSRALARFSCSLITISQNLSDFYSGPEGAQTPGQVILSQSNTRVTFRMDDSEMNTLPLTILPREDRQLLLQCELSETAAEMIVRDAFGERGMLRVVPPPDLLTRIGQAPHHRAQRELETV